MIDYKESEILLLQKAEYEHKIGMKEMPEETFQYYVNQIIFILNSKEHNKDYRPIIYLSDYLDKKSAILFEDLEIFNMIFQSTDLYQNQLFHLTFFNKWFEILPTEVINEAPIDFFLDYLPKIMANTKDIETKKIICSIYVFALNKSSFFREKLMEPRLVDFVLNELRNELYYFVESNGAKNFSDNKRKKYVSALILLVEEFVKNEDIFRCIVPIFQEPELLINNLFIYSHKSANAIMSLINTVLEVTPFQYHSIFLTNEIINLIISQLFRNEIYQIASLELLTTISTRYPLILINTLFHDITLIPEKITPRCFVKICRIMGNILSFQNLEFLDVILHSPIFPMMLDLVDGSPFIVQKEMTRIISIILQTDNFRLIKEFIEKYCIIIPLLKDVLEQKGDHLLTTALAFCSLYKFTRNNDLSWTEQNEYFNDIFDDNTVELLQSIENIPKSVLDMLEQIFIFLEEGK